jgi:succinoglycan biosynthesis transport protein ExoP
VTGASPQRSVLETIRQVWPRRRRLALVVFASCAAAAGAATVALPNLYRATATVLIEGDQVSQTIVRPAVTGALDTRLESMTQRVLSRDRLSALVRRFELYPARKKEPPMDAKVERMRRDIAIELKGVDSGYDRGATVAFALSYRGTDPATVAAVANALADCYVSENRESRERQASGASGFLESQLRELKATMDERQRRVDAFRQRYMGELPEQVGTNLSTLERLNGELQQNRERQLRAAERSEAARRADPNGAIRPDATPAERLDELTQQLARLRARYSEAHPDVVALEAQIASAKAEVAAGRANGTGDAPRPGVDGERASLEADERRILAQIRAYEARVETAPRHDAEMQQLTRDFESAKESYDAVRKREDDARLADQLEKGRMGEQFRILDPAVVPLAPEAPSRLKLFLAGLLAAAGAAVVAIALKEQADTSFHTVDALRALTTVPILASIPRIVTKRDKRRAAVRSAIFAGVASVIIVLVSCAAWRFASGNDGLVALLTRGSR